MERLTEIADWSNPPDRHTNPIFHFAILLASVGAQNSVSSRTLSEEVPIYIGDGGDCFNTHTAWALAYFFGRKEISAAVV